MIIRSSSAGNINHIAVQKDNKPVESQTPQVAETGSFIWKNQQSAFKSNKQNSQENKQSKKAKKSALEILMEED